MSTKQNNRKMESNRPKRDVINFVSRLRLFDFFLLLLLLLLVFFVSVTSSLVTEHTKSSLTKNNDNNNIHVTALVDDSKILLYHPTGWNKTKK
jgi:hypothetical protein